LYPGTENYKTLEVSLAPLCQDLIQLKNYGINDTSGKHWNIKLYFSADWKFLAISLGFNAANSNFFCPWCDCSRKDLALQECKQNGNFNNEIRANICNEMHNLGNYTALMGDEKLLVLKNFNLTIMLPYIRAKQVRNLWTDFYYLYEALKNPSTNSEIFANNAKI
ncbi:4892_t:CDS:2, partial [Scutellospora calospora]